LDTIPNDITPPPAHRLSSAVAWEYQDDEP